MSDWQDTPAYVAHNLAQYDEVTARINGALEAFRQGRIMFKSQAELARYCKVDRVTLFRRGVSDEFNDIKAMHKAQAQEAAKPKETPAEKADRAKTREKQLREQIRRYQHENGAMYIRLLELEEALDNRANVSNEQQRKLAQAEDELAKARGRIRELEQALRAYQTSGGNVTPLRPITPKDKGD